MNSITLESCWIAAKRRMTSLWSTENHTAPFGLNTPPVYAFAEQSGVPKLLRPAYK
jgi:hypothetical protein